MVPVLFYHGGRSPYPYTQLWTDCFPLPDMANELYTQPFPLVDVTVIDDNELVNHRKVAVMELAMKHKYLRDEFDTIIPLLAQALNQQYKQERITKIDGVVKCKECKKPNKKGSIKVVRSIRYYTKKLKTF
nr:Transposase [Providencia alcalifaciens]